MDINLTNCSPEDVKKLQEIFGFNKVEIKDSKVRKSGEKIGSLGLPKKPITEIMDDLRRSMKDSDITPEEWLSYRHD